MILQNVSKYMRCFTIIALTLNDTFFDKFDIKKRAKFFFGTTIIYNAMIIIMIVKLPNIGLTRYYAYM